MVSKLGVIPDHEPRRMSMIVLKNTNRKSESLASFFASKTDGCRWELIFTGLCIRQKATQSYDWVAL